MKRTRKRFKPVLQSACAGLGRLPTQIAAVAFSTLPDGAVHTPAAARDQLFNQLADSHNLRKLEAAKLSLGASASMPLADKMFRVEIDAVSAVQEAAAAKLRDAYTDGAIPPMRDVLASNDSDGAYAVQAINTRFWEGQGRRVVGRKVGLTAKAVQQQLGVDQPDFGVLFADMEIADGGVLPPARLIQPKAEAEVALILGADLPGPNVTRAMVEAAVAEVVAAIEIVDSRIADWKITFADTVADNGSSALFVLGQVRKSLVTLDLWTCGMALELNGEVASLGAGVACLGHPLNAATWLAQTLAERGQPLRKGDVVLTGALGPMVAIKPGDQVRATIGGLGSVSFTYGSP